MFRKRTATNCSTMQSSNWTNGFTSPSVFKALQHVLVALSTSARSPHLLPCRRRFSHALHASGACSCVHGCIVSLGHSQRAPPGLAPPPRKWSLTSERLETVVMRVVKPYERLRVLSDNNVNPSQCDFGVTGELPLLFCRTAPFTGLHVYVFEIQSEKRACLLRDILWAH